ncbi:SGNH/GDSL hydrolase family protein [soil metagenome]
MKKLVLLLLAGASVLARGAELHPKDFVAICGDSITENKIYSVYLADYLLLCQPAAGLRAMQFGWSGEIAAGFRNRITHDVLPFHPTVATICYGMNDGGYAATSAERLSQYRTALVESIKELKNGGVRFIVIASPGAVDIDTYTRDVGAEVYNHTLGDFGETAKQVAAENGVGFADIHNTLYDAMKRAKEKYGREYHVCGSDGVHPSENGNLVMAGVLLKALGCTGDIGTFTLDLKSGQAQATEGHRIMKAARGEATIESTRYPFCFYGDPAKPDSARGMLAVYPFNDDLNRLQLVVKNVPPGRLRLTWGSVSKEFASADLAKGINLAAEFPDNPFSEPFAKAQAAIREQQKMDTYLVKEFLHWTPGWSHLLPGNETNFAQLETSVVKRANEAANTVQQSLVPVEHTIRVESVP